MKLTYDQVREMNDVQIEIFKVFTRICQKLNLKYYMVHGSLLGAYTRGSFFPFDDDIDVAMPRKDYDILMDKGNEFVPEGYFIQSCETEPNFPLAFGKIRKSDTAFIQPMFKNLNVNMGMFIDVFPIDNYPGSILKVKGFTIREAVLRARISTKLFYSEALPVWRKVSRCISVLLCPSWNKAVKKRADLYRKVSRDGRVIIIGGKPNERGIPEEWFGNGTNVTFEGVSVTIPSKADIYLKHIYGSYENHNPVQRYMNKDNTLTVTASVVDAHKSYISFIN